MRRAIWILVMIAALAVIYAMLTVAVGSSDHPI